MTPVPPNNDRSATTAATRNNRPATLQDNFAPEVNQLNRVPMCRRIRCHWPEWLTDVGMLGSMTFVVGGMIAGPTPIGMVLVFLAIALFVIGVAGLNQ